MSGPERESFIEKYRGTEWGQPIEPPPPPPRRGRPVLLVVGFALFAIALGGGIVGLGLMLAPRADQPGGIRDRIGATPPAPLTPYPETRVLDAFWDAVQDPFPSYHVSGTGTTRTPAFTTSFTLEYDVAGDDYAGRVTTTGPGATGPASIVRKGGFVFVRPDSGGDWFGRKTDDPVLLQTPFMGLGGRSFLRYDTPVTGDAGESWHRLASTDQYRPSIPRMLGISTFPMSPDLVALEIIVTDAGVPVRSAFRVEAGGTDANGEPIVLGTARYEFTEWGKEFTITAPK